MTKTQKYHSLNKRQTKPGKAALLFISSYEPFGRLQPYRHWEAPNYKHRFGLSGMEKDDEMKDPTLTLPEGEGNKMGHPHLLTSPSEKMKIFIIT